MGGTSDEQRVASGEIRRGERWHGGRGANEKMGRWEDVGRAEGVGLGLVDMATPLGGRLISVALLPVILARAGPGGASAAHAGIRSGAQVRGRVCRRRVAGGRGWWYVRAAWLPYLILTQDLGKSSENLEIGFGVPKGKEGGGKMEDGLGDRRRRC